MIIIYNEEKRERQTEDKPPQPKTHTQQKWKSRKWPSLPPCATRTMELGLDVLTYSSFVITAWSIKSTLFCTSTIGMLSHWSRTLPIHLSTALNEAKSVVENATTAACAPAAPETNERERARAREKERILPTTTTTKPNHALWWYRCTGQKPNDNETDHARHR